MGSQSQSIIPVIDFSSEDLKPGTKTWVSTREEIPHALEEYGCFEAIYGKVSLDLHHQTFARAAELFGLPTEVKTKNTSTKPYFGYLGQSSSVPLYETLAIDDPTTLESAQSFTNLMWPFGNDRFCENAHSWSELVAELNKMVIRMLFESYGVETDYKSYTESVNYVLRYYKYRVPDVNETTMGLPPHTDTTLMSIIHQHHVKGLQIKIKDSEWIDFEPSTHCSFLFMAGQALMAWSNDRILPCCHQVIMSHSNTERYSLGLLSFISGIIEIPQELVDDANPSRYKSFDHFEFLHFHQSQVRQKLPSSIKAYCGI